jgi:hypothetical protein
MIFTVVEITTGQPGTTSFNPVSNKDVTQQADDAAVVPWGYPALLLATLFLNAAFWYGEGPEFPLHGPAVWYFVQVFGAPILLGALFYLGPALAAQASKLSLFELAATSLGSIGALVLRVCCSAFLVLWLGEQFNLIVRWSVPLWAGSRTSATAEGVAAGIFVLFLFWSGLQDQYVAARLAFFTNKLGASLLIAALIRVREGLPAAIHALDKQRRLVETPDLWRGLAQLAFWAAPLLFLASNFGRPCQSRKQVYWIGLFGIVIPVAGTLLVLGFIERAAHNSGASTQGIANIVSALFHGDSSRYFLKLVAVLAITMFGAARYGIGALANCLTVFLRYSFVYWALLGLAAFAIAVIAATLSTDLSAIVNPLARSLVAAAAVITADFLTGRWRAASTQKMDWIGMTAFLIGWGLPYVPFLIIDVDPPGWDPWLLRTYTMSFSICLLGRMASIGYDRSEHYARLRREQHYRRGDRPL